MGHIGPKDTYMLLADKIDAMVTRAPRNETLFEIMKELYTPEEADLVARMPYGLSTLERVASVTRMEKTRLRKMLEGLANKGLVMDIMANGEYHYTVSPMVIGIFEFTMMRTRGELNYKKWAGLFKEYLAEPFYAANYDNGQVVSPLRTIPHEGTIDESLTTEILDYEKATAVINSHTIFSIGTCSCRHKKQHAGERECTTPLNTCSTFGYAADYWIRNKLAKKVSKSEMLENVARSRELGLALSGDNVNRNLTFICHCCKCCCAALAGISKYGYAHSVITSNYIARIDHEKCNGCGKCAKACAIDIIGMRPVERPTEKRRMTPVIDESFCLGCGVCAVKCPKGAITLVPRKSRVLHPETTFEKVILGALERNNLQYQLFDNPESVTQKFLRGLMGGFFRLPPVKRALMSDRLRSRFLDAMKKGVVKMGKGWVLEM